MARGGSEQQWLPSINVTGFGNLGVFDMFSGGNVTATPPKNRPGGMGPELTYVGLPVYSDVVLTRVYEETRDHVLIGQLHAVVGEVYATVALQPLDDNANPFGSPRTYYGRLAAIDDGTTDSNSATVRKWTITIAVETIGG
jgi:hypothetical protein